MPFPLQRRSTSDPSRWRNAILVFSLHRVPFLFSVHCTEFSMTRPRGRPRRGSPWKPRRPSITPPDSTSADSSPQRQSRPIPVSLHAPQLSSMAIISRTPISILRLSHDPSAVPSSSTASGDPLGNLGGDPYHHSAPKRAGPCFPESVDRVQFAESLAILHDLVFELRQEIADLQYRVQATEGKVASFMQILSSMHEALFTATGDTSPKENPETAKDEAQDKTQTPEAVGRKQDKKERKDDRQGPCMHRRSWRAMGLWRDVHRGRAVARRPLSHLAQLQANCLILEYVCWLSF
jgi:hypothetical protein